MKLKFQLLFSICTLYVLLWGLYGFHWYDTAKGTAIDGWSSVFLGINLAISFFCVLLLKGKVARPVFRGVNALILVFIIYGGLYIICGDTHYMHGHAVNKGSYLIGILRSYLPLYAFYYFTIKGHLNQKTLPIYVIILFAFSLVYNVYAARYWFDIGYESGFTNNLGYVFISFFPVILLFKKSTIFQYILVAIIMGLTITSMKRGAIIISLILLLWFLRISLSQGKSSKRFTIIFLSFILLLIGYLYINNLYESSDYFKVRIEQTMSGESSGRNVLYASLLDHFWNDSSVFQQIFGSGPDTAIDILGKEAHNDWLEILTSQGLFGVIIYAYFWFSCFRYWRRMPKTTVYYHMVGMFLITQFLRSFFSMSYATIPTVATLLLGYAAANNDIMTTNINNSRNNLRHI